MRTRHVGSPVLPQHTPYLPFRMLIERSCELFGSSPIHFLSTFLHVDWAGNPDDQHSTTSYVAFLGQDLISWSSRKLLLILLPNYSGYTRSLKSIILFHIAHFVVRQYGGDLSFASNSVFHVRTKHTEIDFHFVRDMITRKDLTVAFISTKDNIVDALTKPSSSSSFLHNKFKLNVVPKTPTGLRGGISLSC